MAVMLIAVYAHRCLPRYRVGSCIGPSDCWRSGSATGSIPASWRRTATVDRRWRRPREETRPAAHSGFDVGWCNRGRAADDIPPHTGWRPSPRSAKYWTVRICLLSARGRRRNRRPPPSRIHQRITAAENKQLTQSVRLATARDDFTHNVRPESDVTPAILSRDFVAQLYRATKSQVWHALSHTATLSHK